MNILRFDQNHTNAAIGTFNDLMLDTFGFSFEAWHRQGHWSKDYSCYAILENGSMIASAWVYRMEMLISGMPKTCYEIGAVATRKERRGEGLSRRILDLIFDEHAGETFFLCANQSVLAFYPRFGFRQITERQPWIEERLNAHRPGMVQLDIAADRWKIDTYLKRRSIYSNFIDCTNAAPIYWFYLLLAHSDHVYEIPNLGALLIAEQGGEVLTLHDACATTPICFTDLASYLAFDGVREIHFGFNPDWLGVEPRYREPEGDSTLFVRGEMDLPAEFILPMLIRT